MSPVYLNPQHSSTIPFIELKGDHQHNLPIIMGYVHDHVTSSNTNNNTYFSISSFDNNNNNTSNEYPVVDYSRRTQERVIIDQKVILSHDKPIVYPFNNHGDNNINKIIKIDQKPKKCKQSKERIMQKASTTTVKSKRMIIGDHNLNYDHGNYNLHAQVKQSNMYYHKSRNEIIKNNNNNFIRTCTDCHTTTTPLWRSGPQGPKSLCNACGIRQRKARRAAAAAMAPMDDDAPLPSPISSTTTTTTTTRSPNLTLEVEEVKSPKNLDHETIMTHTLPLKKRSKTFNDHTSWNYNNSNNNNNINSSNNDNDNMDNNNNNINNNDYSSRPSNYSTQRVFPKDVEEGAILLMALSCGLACSS